MNFRKLCFTDETGQIINEYPLSSLPIKEDALIKKSIEIFNDPEPCIIHRTYIAKKLFFDLLGHFDSTCDHRKWLLLRELPSEMVSMLEIDVSSIGIKIV